MSVLTWPQGGAVLSHPSGQAHHVMFDESPIEGWAVPSQGA
jgi:hypothetical protein